MIGLGLSITQLAVRQMLGGPSGYDPIQDFANGEQGFIYDISDLSTLFQDTAGTIPAVVGLSVARINDKSGNGNHATQVTPSSRAILRFVDGKYWLQTDGTDDWYITPTVTSGTDKAQVFVGVRKLSDANVAAILEHGVAGSMPVQERSTSLLIASSKTIDALGRSYSQVIRAQTAPEIQAIVGIAPYIAPVTSVLSILTDRAETTAANEIKWQHNGSPVASVVAADQNPTGDFGSYPFYIFRRGGTALPFNGMISSIVMRFGPNLTPEQIANMNAWTNDRAGAY